MRGAGQGPADFCTVHELASWKMDEESHSILLDDAGSVRMGQAAKSSMSSCLKPASTATPSL